MKDRSNINSYRAYLVGLLFFSIYCNSQQLKGVVTDSLEQPIFNTTITVKDVISKKLLYYTISDTLGKFHFKYIDFSKGKMELDFRHPSYNSKSVLLDNNLSDLYVKLSLRINNLKEILIKEPDILYRRDTLSYSVSSFKDLNDRSIADVIKNMPGLEVTNSGAILYQGRPIEKFYIEGLNLLDGKYSLASSNINANDVSKVEVLENHEPKAILDSISTTTRTSINIKLKNGSVRTGLGELGSGYEPLLYNVNATPLFLKARQQHIFSYQSNNISTNLEDLIKDFSIEATIKRLQENVSGLFLLNNFNITVPIRDLYFRDNNDHLFTVNSLFAVKEGLQLKYKISYLNQQTEQLSSFLNKIITPETNVSFLEEKKIKVSKNLLNTDFTLENNSKELYLKNELSFNFLDLKADGDLSNSNFNFINSKTDQRYYEIKNRFETIIKINDFLVDCETNLDYIDLSEYSKSISTSNAELFPVSQIFDRSHLSLSASAGTKKVIGFFTPDVQIAFRYNANDVRSLGTSGLFSSNNDYDFIESSYIIDPGIDYQKKKLSISIRTPISVKSFNLDNASVGLIGKSNFLLFQPSMQFRNKFSDQIDLLFNSSYSDNFNNYSDMFINPVFTTFRTSVSNIPIINRTTTFSNGLFFRFKNLLRNYFFNTSIDYERSTSNITRINTINNNGVVEITYLPIGNRSNSFSWNMKFDKVIPQIATTSKSTISVGSSNSEVFINEQFTDIKTTTVNASQEFISDITPYILLYNKLTYDNSRINLLNSRISFMGLSIFNEITFDISKKLQIIGSQNFYSFKNNSSSFKVNFLNVSLERKLKNNRAINVSVNNLLNEDRFERISLSNNSIATSSYNLRPRQILISYLFNF
ncbi:MAG: Plug domain-containing protein [Nonlabens sp.]